MAESVNLCSCDFDLGLTLDDFEFFFNVLAYIFFSRRGFDVDVDRFLF